MVRSDRRTRKGLRPELVSLWICVGVVLTLWASVPAWAQIGASSPLGGLGQEPAFALPEDLGPQWSLPLEELRVTGNVRADSILIVRSSGLELGYPARPATLASSVRSLYQLSLFSDIAIYDETPMEGDVPAEGVGRKLRIEVTENPRIESIRWDGQDKMSEEDLRAEIELRAGDLLSRRKLFAATNALRTYYQDEGYASADIVPTVDRQEDGDVELVFTIDEGKRVKIKAIEFVGNEALSDDKLGGEVKLKPNGLFRRKRYTAERAREDVGHIESYYHNHGYRDAEVTSHEAVFSEDAEGEVTLRYEISEGPFYQFGSVEWTGNTAVTTDDLNRVSAVRKGEAFSQEKVELTLSEAYGLYTEHGYLVGLDIFPAVSIEADTVDVAFQVREGEPSKVNEVRIVGNTRTKERVIRRELTLVPGNLLRRSVLMRSQRDAFALGYFEDVQVEYQPVGTGSDIDVVFRVKEKSSGTATAGAGFSSETGITGFLEFGHNNLFGTGKALNLHLERGSRRKTYDISFTEPWAFNTPTSIGFHVFDTTRDLDFYDEKTRGFSINVGRPWFFRVPDYTRVFVSYSLEDLRFRNFTNLDEESEAYLKASNGTVSRLALSFSRNSTNNPFYPTAGSRTSLRSEIAGGYLGGEVDYLKPTIDHRNYFVPFWKPAVMLRHRVGYLFPFSKGGRVPGNETFRLGGTRTDYLRGYDDWYVVPEDNIRVGSSGSEIRFPGGKVMYSFTAEYQFPLFNPVHGLLFFDAGNTWNTVRDASFSDLKKGVGAGIRLEIPLLGNVGFDYAYGIDRGKWQPHLIIGPAF
ncbi:MAG: outer membrane protein assembly factor BamA [Candidatus Eisenbacteria bacterium]|nr:outer membrane protein assembly factor BamA [Candidatus Eisenbacteria bacterium]